MAIVIYDKKTKIQNKMETMNGKFQDQKIIFKPEKVSQADYSSQSENTGFKELGLFQKKKEIRKFRKYMSE